MFALVTGSTGFLGTHLVQRLREAGHRVRALVRTPSKAGVLAAAGAELSAGDITSPTSLARAVEGIEVIFHAAALVTNWAPWSSYQAVTVQGTENLLDAASRVRIQRFVHISTIRVYDDHFCRQHGVVTEDAPHGKRGFRQFGYYARAKVLAEAAVWRRSPRLPVSVLRPAWIYGPGDEVILPGLVRFLRDPQSLWPGRTNPCADPIYATDVADCALAAAVHPGAIGQAYNVAPQQRIGSREFVGLLCEALDIKMPERTAPYIVATTWAQLAEWCAWLARRPNPPAITRAGVAMISEDVRHDPTKAERELGWRSAVGLADGVAQTARWLRERHPELLAR